MFPAGGKGDYTPATLLREQSPFQFVFLSGLILGHKYRVTHMTHWTGATYAHLICRYIIYGVYTQHIVTCYMGVHVICAPYCEVCR